MDETIDLSAWLPAEDEPAGENEKTWFLNPADNSRWIFKPNREHRSENEHASEFVASRIARIIGVPAAEVRIATLGGRTGCISRDVRSSAKNGLESGSVFIGEHAEDFDPKAKLAQGHSLENLRMVLNKLEPPIGMDGTLTAGGWFAGYLVFDALIGNQDRHSENWAVEVDEAGTYHLAPSFDHATSMGIVLRNYNKLARVLNDTDRLQQFAQRARGGRFEGMKATSLVDVAATFLNGLDADVSAYWREALEGLTLDDVSKVVASSKMSEPNASLAIALITLNRERLLQCLST